MNLDPKEKFSFNRIQVPVRIHKDDKRKLQEYARELNLERERKIKEQT